jgi:predicted DNA-binding protein
MGGSEWRGNRKQRPGARPTVSRLEQFQRIDESRTCGLVKWQGFANPPWALASDNYAIMSDMSSERITVRIPQELGGRLRQRSRIKGQTESDLIREALETYLGRSNGERSALDLAEEAGLIGVIRRGGLARPPKDLSTNPRHFKGFGKDQ